MNDRSSVLFVCLGNICRSPLAEHLFRRLAASRGVGERFVVGSCGMGGWHVGGGADPRTIAIAARFGWALEHTARQFNAATDVARFRLIVPMDRDNLRALLSAGAPADRVRLMRSFDPAFDPAAPPDVPDPYYGGPEGFVHMYQMLDDACAGLLAHLLDRGS